MLNGFSRSDRENPPQLALPQPIFEAAARAGQIVRRIDGYYLLQSGYAPVPVSMRRARKSDHRFGGVVLTDQCCVAPPEAQRLPFYIRAWMWLRGN